jgi:hypothetical protein
MKLPDFAAYCEQACIKLWGPPDQRTRAELRWNGTDSYGARVYNIKKRAWYDHGQERGGSTLHLPAYDRGQPAQELKGAAFFQAWREAYAMEIVRDKPPEKTGGGRGMNSGGTWPPIIAAYPYTDEQGALLFEVVRFDTANPLKRFRQRKPDGTWSIKGIRRMLYRLPELIAAVKAGERVLVCEGERDADSALALGYAATTMPGGVGKWRKDYDRFFAGADVVVVSDNDAHGKGQAHAAQLAKRLAKVATRVRVVMFPQKDLTEWVEAGGTREQLDALIELTPIVGADKADDKRDESNGNADAEIERLAKLTAIEYEQQRKGVAETLGLRASILDRLVEGERARLNPNADGKQGRPVTFPEPEPWGEPVSGPALLNGIAGAIRRHVVMPRHAVHAAALWTLHTFLVSRFFISPRLGVRSPTKGCGKTLLLDVLGRLVLRPLPTANVTPSAIFRAVEAHQPCLLIDEVDTFLYENDELRGVLNSGYRKGGCVLRTVGEDFEPRSFATYSACAIAMIGSLPDTLHDRAVTIDLQRRRPRQRIEPFRPDRADYLDVLGRKAARWASDHADRIGERDPAMPDGIINRAADNWRPLVAIADEAGGRWPERARAATRRGHSAEMDDGSLFELLLADIRDVFGERTQMASADLVAALVAIEGRPWADGLGKNRDKPLTTNRLAGMLKRFKIASGNIRVGSKVPKGYVAADFAEAFASYLPPKEGASEPLQRYKADETGTSDLFQTATAKTDVADRKCEKPANDGLCSGVAVQKGGAGAKTRVETLPEPAEPDALDEHAMPADEPAAGLGEARRQELASWCRRWTAEGEDPADLKDALRMTVREEVGDRDLVEPEVARVLAIVREGGSTR